MTERRCSFVGPSPPRRSSVDRRITILARFLALYDERLLASTRLYDGMADTIDRLRDDAQLAVLTNKPAIPTRKILEGLGVIDRFRWVIGGDGPFPRKPDPAGLRHLMAQANTSPDRSILIGDSGVDLATARGAGTRICLARYGFGYRIPAADLQGDELIADIRPTSSPSSVQRSSESSATLPIGREAPIERLRFVTSDLSPRCRPGSDAVPTHMNQ